ncbi:hypothetical protein KKG52_03480 [Patescibacteria group bacterium]|nr:hypothetical protein [Patescibacteria group bacterium]
MQKSAAINFLASRKPSFLDRFLNWSLTIGRLIVIVVEIIALSAFIYRFTLDRQIIDLHSEIKKGQAIIEYYKPEEDKYRNLQERLAIAAEATSIGEKKIKIYNEFLKIIPVDVSLKSINMSEDTVGISIDVFSISSLSKVVESIKEYKEVQKISVNKIENNPSAGTISVFLTTTLSNNKEKE